MMKRFLLVIFFMLIVITCLLLTNYDKSFKRSDEKCGESSESKFVIDNVQKNQMQNVALLGAIQGVTEFLPVSSTGHMILFENLFNREGPNDLHRDAMNAYFAVIQSGSLLAILILYWSRMRDMFNACLFKSARGGYLIRDLVISFLPAGLLGFLFNGVLQNLFYNPFCIACALIFGAFLMGYAEKWYIKNGEKIGEITGLSITNCVKIGLWQCLALIPGMSRSMSTIVGGYFCNLNKRSAAEYSFLLGFVTLSAATFFKLWKDHDVLFQYFSMRIFLYGIFFAFIFSILTIRMFVAYLNKYGLWIFVWYRLFLGVLILFLLK